MKTSRMFAGFAVLGCAVIPTLAFAHTGAGSTSGLMAGLTHPIFGPDHLAAMVAVGLLAGLAAGPALWLLPAGFVTAMLAGAGAALIGAHAPAVESLILASVMVLGAAAALRIGLPVSVMLAVVVFFGFFHGFAHGLEAPAGGSVASYLAGFTISTAALHGIGTLIGRSAPLLVTRIAGACFALLGLGLAVAG